MIRVGRKTIAAVLCLTIGWSCAPKPDGSDTSDAGVIATDGGRLDGSQQIFDAGTGINVDGHVVDAGGLDAAAGDAGAHTLSDAGPRDASSRPNVVFVTSITVSPGSLGGISAADTICADRASAAALPGHFVAFLSTSTQRAEERLAGSRGWVRTDGEPFLDHPADVNDGRVYYPPVLDEYGHRAVNDLDPASPWHQAVEVATGWVPPDSVAAPENCANWTSSTAVGRVGISPWGRVGWASGDTRLCSHPMHLYCFETGYDFALPPMSTDGFRIAFAGRQPNFPSDGLASFDYGCGNEAAIFGLQGTFKALVATVGHSAAERLSDGLPWVRPDGVMVFESLSAMQSGEAPLAAIDVTADMYYRHGRAGGIIDAFVWNGATAANLPGQESTTCANWSSASSDGGLAALGTADDWSNVWFGGYDPRPCHVGWAQVYCFQE